MSGTMPCDSSILITPIWAKPRAAPPPRTRATFGLAGGGGTGLSNDRLAQPASSTRLAASRPRRRVDGRAAPANWLKLLLLRVGRGVLAGCSFIVFSGIEAISRFTFRRWRKLGIGKRMIGEKAGFSPGLARGNGAKSPRESGWHRANVIDGPSLRHTSATFFGQPVSV